MGREPVALALVKTGTSTADHLVKSWIGVEDRSHCAVRRRPASRAESLLGHAALCALLALRTDRADWILHNGPQGALCARTSDGQPGPSVSLSHSGGIVACALSRVGAIGIDIERHRPRSIEAIATYAFGPTEQASVRLGGSTAFYRIWTLREAIAKATTEGLSLAADGRDRVGNGPEEGFWISRQSASPWQLAHFFPQPGYSLAIAIPGEGMPWSAASIGCVDLTDATAGEADDAKENSTRVCLG